MSRRYETTATLTINGDERDVKIRAHVMYERQPGGSWGGSLDGEAEALVIVDEPYDSLGTPGKACLCCNSAWPANEPASHDSACSVEEWVLLSDLDLSPRERERAEEALCDECSNDDSSQCVERAS